MALTDVKSEQIQSSVALAGSPTTTTQSASDNSTKIATTAYVETAVANLVASAPSALNTLDELAAALNDDASFSTTVTNSIATKLPLAGGTMSGALNMGSQNITNAGTIAGTLSTAAQPNITSTGNLNALGITGNLTVDTNTFHVDASNNRVGIGTTSPAAGVKFQAVHNVADEWVADFKHTHADAYGLRVDLSGTTSSSRLAFGTYTGGGTGFFVRNDGKAILGGTTVQGGGLLTLEGSDANMLVLHRTADTGDQEIIFMDHGDHNATIAGKNVGGLRLLTNGRNTTAIDMLANGHVGIGAAPSFPFHVSSTDQNVAVIDSDNNSGTYLWVRNSDATTGRTANIGFAPANNIEGARVVAEAIEDFSTSANRTADLAFQVRHNGTMAERWRIHSDGALVSQAQTPVAIGGTPADANFTELGSGYLNLARDDTADADQILFAKNGAIHTKLKTINGAFVIDSASGNVHVTANSNSLNYNGSTLKPFDSDNGQIDLGTAGARYKDIYSAGGILLSGTAAKNRLENFEDLTNVASSINLYKGSTLVSSSYNARWGYYARVGNLVFISFYFYVNNGGATASGEYRVYGFPFNFTHLTNSGYQSIPTNYLTLNGTNIFNSTTGNHRWQANSTTYLSLYGNYSTTNWTSGIIEFAGSGVLYIN